MDRPEHDYGRAFSIDAEAIGRPGQRRFRLLIRSTGETAVVWMEKQQLAGIGTWFEESLRRLDQEHPTNEPEVEPLGGPEPSVEFWAGQIGLGYAEADDVFALEAFDQDQAGADHPALRCLISRGQSHFLSRKIAEVVAAGRPICPLCQSPIEPEGHVCPRSNGHYETPPT